MSKKLIQEDVQRLVGGTIRISTENGIFVSTVTEITVSDIPEHGITPKFQTLSVYHSGFFIENSGDPVDASSPLIYVSRYMDWYWSATGVFISTNGLDESLSIIPYRR